MKKIVIISILLLALILTSCDSNPKIPVGSINVVSVTPNTGLSDGVPTEFTVVVDYSLVDSDQGEITAVFNTGDEVNHYYSGDSEVINEGSGSVTIVTTESPKNWGAEGDFAVLVIFEQYPYSSENETLDTEKIDLSF